MQAQKHQLVQRPSLSHFDIESSPVQSNKTARRIQDHGASVPDAAATEEGSAVRTCRLRTDRAPGKKASPDGCPSWPSHDLPVGKASPLGHPCHPPACNSSCRRLPSFLCTELYVHERAGCNACKLKNAIPTQESSAISSCDRETIPRKTRNTPGSCTDPAMLALLRTPAECKPRGAALHHPLGWARTATPGWVKLRSNWRRGFEGWPDQQESNPLYEEKSVHSGRVSD